MILFQLNGAGFDSRKCVVMIWEYNWFNCGKRVQLDNWVAMNVTGSLPRAAAVED